MEVVLSMQFRRLAALANPFATVRTLVEWSSKQLDKGDGQIARASEVS
jgi:hypothetical protein